MIPRLWLVPVLLCLSAGQLAAQSFDPAPLREPIAFPVYGLPADWPEFRAWLEDSAATVDEPRLVQAREHLYAIISAAAKRRVADALPAMPDGVDAHLAEMFTWADRIGVVGAGLVAARLLGWPADFQIRTGLADGFRLSFDSMYTIVAEHDGWMMRVPHYFMLGLLQRQTPQDGVPTSIIVLSTLFADDSTTSPDASQATIMAVSGAIPAPEMAAFWLQRIGLAATDTAASPVPNAIRAYRGRDRSGRVAVELVVFAPSRERSILFAYVGLDGTYEANRPHFVDLLSTLRIRGDRLDAPPSDD